MTVATHLRMAVMIGLTLAGCASHKAEDTGLKVVQNPAPVGTEAADLVVTVEGDKHYSVRGQSLDAELLNALLQEQDRMRPLHYVLVRGPATLPDLVYLASIGNQLGYIILYDNQGLKTLSVTR